MFFKINRQLIILTNIYRPINEYEIKIETDIIQKLISKIKLIIRKKFRKRLKEKEIK